jgi:uncharacterized membrane protein YebE (DUF533 family)
MDAIDTIKILGSLLGSGGLSNGTGGDVLGNILKGALSGGSSRQTQGGGMLGDILGSLVGGGAKSTSGGGMGDLLGGLLGGGQNRSQGGNMGDLLGSLLGGASSNNSQPSQNNDNGMGDLLGNLLGGGARNDTGLGGAGGLGGLLGGALTKYMQSQNKDVPNPTPEHCDHLPQNTDQKEAVDHATLIIRAMINAAKSDGGIDRDEQEKIIQRLGDITQAEADFVRAEFNAPLDINEFINSVPRGMEEQIYTVSLMAIDLDTNKEAAYLRELAKGFRIRAVTANDIHKQLGAPTIFA